MDLITGRIYKPNRVLYFIEPTEEEKNNFYKNIIPDVFKPYVGAFGTYDSVGLFKIKKDDCYVDVIGLEFRPDDKRITYPDNMASIMLPSVFMVYCNISSEELLDDDKLQQHIDNLTCHMSYVLYHSINVKPLQNPDVIELFTSTTGNRILLNTKPVSKDDFFNEIIPVTENEKKLYDVAYRDSLTNHYNWNHIWPRIAGYGLLGIQDFVFAHFDIKDFKAINVVYGHDVANDVLTRIVNKMNETDWIYHSARCDNDNFAMMIKDMPNEELKEKLTDFFNDITILREDPNYHIYYRCGVVPMRSSLILGDRVADAGKQAQRTGTKLYETEIIFFEDSMAERLDWSIRTKAYLDTAIEKDEFLVYLQPKYDIKTEKIYGAEALIRWMYHGRELLSPWRFIPIFETGGLISKLDDIVLKKVCSYLKKWKSEGLPLYPISVNLSRKSLGNPNLVDHLTAIVDSYDVDHHYIDFELTESAAYDNQKYMISVLNQLKDRGFKISMDDFGTGYSSLSLLPVMPMDTLKIDKSFVDGLISDEDNYKECSIIKHIISISKDLGFTCLAEGAEEKQQIDKLKAFGCEIVQGYYYCKPIPVDEYEKFLQ